MSKIPLPDKRPEVPRFVIVSRNAASHILMSKSQGPSITHVISIASPVESRAAAFSNVAPPTGFSTTPARRLRILFDDIEGSRLDREADYHPPGLIHATEILTFLRLVPEDGFLLIHCQAGQSRSTAVGLAFAALHLGKGREQEAFTLTKGVTRNPYCCPNVRLVQYFDELLGCRGMLMAQNPGVRDCY